MFQQIKNERRGLTGTLILSLVLLMLVSAILPVSAVTLNGYEIVFVSHTYDGTYSTWTYTVTSGSGVSPAISHWIIAWCGGADSIADASHTYEYKAPDSPDPTTGKYGIKFDFSFSEGVPVTFWFKLYGDFAQGDVEVTIKAGSDVVLTGIETGPVFSFGVDGAITGTGEDDTWLVATAETDNPGITSVTFYWYGPFEAGTSGPDVTRLWDGIAEWYNHPTPGTLTVDWVETDTTAPYESTPHLITLDHLGEWYVVAEFEGGFHPGEANDTVEVNLVPWFTSLPLAMLAIVGTVFLLRRKGSISLPV